MDEDLFSLEADAILEEAPDYQTGFTLLEQSYLEYKDEDKAQDKFKFYNTLLSKQFQEPDYYDYLTTKDEIAPIALEEIEGADSLDKINQWEKENTEALLAETEDPYIIANRDKWLTSIKRAAISERRLLNGKDTLDEFEARQAEVTDEEGLLYGTGRKALGGAVGGISGLLGFEETEEVLTARDLEESFAAGVAGDIAAGVGFMGGLVTSSAVGAAAGSVVPGIGTTAGGVAGAAGFIIGNAVEAVFDAYDTAEEVSGDKGKALAAASVETGSQVLQAAIGGKAVVGITKRALSKTLGTKTTELAAGVGFGAATGVVGGGLSSVAQEVGEEGAAYENYDYSQIVKNASRGLLAGAGVGTISAAGGLAFGQFTSPAGDRHTTELNRVNSPVDSSENFVADSFGNQYRVNKNLGEVSLNYDATFLVPEVLGKALENLKQARDPEREPVKIYVNEDGDLVVRNPYVGPDLQIKDTPVNLGEIILKTGEGEYVVDVMRPRIREDGGNTYTSRVTKKSAGAASIEEFGKERQAAKRLRENPILDERLRLEFGDPDGPGLQRYMPITNLDLKNSADAKINEIGFEKSIGEYLSTPLEISTPELVAFGARLVAHLRSAYNAAKKAGDQIAAEKLAEYTEDVSIAYVQRRTKEGQVLQAGNLSEDALSRTVDLVQGKARKSAQEEIASEDSLSIREVEDTSADLQAAEDRLLELQKKQDPAVVELDSVIDDTETLLKEADTLATDALETARKADDDLIAQAEQEKADLENEETVKKSSVEKEEAILDARIKQKQEELKTLEEKSREAAKKRRGAQIKAAGSALSKIKKNPKSRVKPEALQKMEGNLELLKTQEPPLSKEEQSALNLLKKDISADLEKQQKVKAAKETRAKSKNEERLQALDTFIKEKTAVRDARSTETEGGKRLQVRRKKLRLQLSEKKQERERAVSKFNSTNEALYRDLRNRVSILKKRKTKIAGRLQKKVDAALPADKFERLKVLQEALNKLSEDSEDRTKIQIEIDKIRHEAESVIAPTPRYTPLLQTFYVANALFRGGTLLLNLGFNTFKLVDLAAGRAVTGFGKGRSVADGLLYLQDFVQAAGKSGFNEAGRAFFEGKDIIKTRVKTAKEVKPGQSLSFLEVDKSSDTAGFGDPVAQLSRLGNTIKLLGYSLRALSAGDAVFTRSAFEAEAAGIVREQGRLEGKRGDALREHVAQKLFKTDRDVALAEAQARKDAQILADVGIKTSDRDLIANTWSIMNKRRQDSIRAEAAYATGISFLNQDINPRGYVGLLSQLVAKAFGPTLTFPGGKKVLNPLSIIQPFVNTTLKVANLTLDSTPLGFAKAAVGKYKVGEPGNVVRNQLGSAIVGTAAMGVLYAALKANGDDKDPWFDIIGPLPKDPGGKAKFYGSKRKPWSIKIGDKTFSFLYTPWVGPLGSVAMLRDKIRDGSINEKNGLEIAGILGFSNLRAFADVPVLKTLTGLVTAITTGEDRQGAFENLAVGIGRNLVPGIAIIEEITRAYDNPVATKNNFWAKLFRATPLASAVGKPALNLFGDPIEPEWYDRLPIVGSTVGRFVGLETEDPDILWLVNNGYNVTGIENTIRISDSTGKYAQVKEMRAKTLGAYNAGVLTGDEAYRLQEMVGPMYRQIVAKYRTAYGDHGYNQKLQDSLKKELSEVKSAVKYKLFIEGATLAP